MLVQSAERKRPKAFAPLIFVFCPQHHNNAPDPLSPSFSRKRLWPGKASNCRSAGASGGYAHAAITVTRLVATSS